MYYIIEYSYPTSTNAKILGYKDTGCFSVMLCPDETMGDWTRSATFATKDEARTHAATLALPPHPLAVKYNHM